MTERATELTIPERVSDDWYRGKAFEIAGKAEGGFKSAETAGVDEHEIKLSRDSTT